MPRENSPAEEPENRAPDRLAEPNDGDWCECCIADGVRRNPYVVGEGGFVLCKRCYEGRCPNCGGG